MNQLKVNGWSLFALLMSSCIMTTIAYPQQMAQQIATQQKQQYQQQTNQYIPTHHLDQYSNNDNRKFAEKPNSIKKVALDDIDDIQTNQISDGNNGFSWSNMLGMVMQMLFQNNNGVNAPTKSDDIDTNGGFTQSPWANVFTVGLKIITALLGGGTNNDGIDKVDNGGSSSPMQNVLAAVFSTMFGAKDPEQVNTMAKQAGEFISIVVNLLDALKTSFSHRSITARSIGKKDSVSDAAVAGISMLKSYVKTYKNADDKCMQKYLCEANTECTSSIGGTSIFCQLGTYATSFVLERQSSISFDKFYEAGRKGRSGVDCRQLYLECNEV